MQSVSFVSGNLLLRPTFAGPSADAAAGNVTLQGVAVLHTANLHLFSLPFPFIAPSFLVLPSSVRVRPVQLDEAEERRNKRPQNVQLPPPLARPLVLPFGHGLLDGA